MNKKLIIVALLLLSLPILGKNRCSLRPASSATVLAPGSLDFSPNDTCLAVAGLNSVSIFGLNPCNCEISSQPVATIPTGGNIPLSLAFSPSGGCLAVYSAGSSSLPPSNISFFSVDQTNCTLVSPTPTQVIPLLTPLTTILQPQAIAFSRDGQFFAFANAVEGIVQIFSFNQSNCTATPFQDLVVSAPVAVAFAHEANVLGVSSGGLGSSGLITLYAFNGSVNQFVATQPATSTNGISPLTFAFSPNDCCLAVTNFLSTGDNISFFKVHKKCYTFEFLKSASSGASTLAIGTDFSPSGKCLAIGSLSGTIGVFTFKDRSCCPCGFKTFSTSSATNLQYSHNGKCLAVANLLADTVSILKQKN